MGPLLSPSINGLIIGMTMPPPLDTRVAGESADAADTDGAATVDAEGDSVRWLRISEAKRSTWLRASSPS